MNFINNSVEKGSDLVAHSKKIYITKPRYSLHSKSWDHRKYCQPNNSTFKPGYPSLGNYFFNDIKQGMYDAITNCKSAGVIPYCLHNGQIYFLFQQIKSPSKRKLMGWNDFGGKRLDCDENTADTAAREFSEETSCLFFLSANSTANNDINYNKLKDNSDIKYDADAVCTLQALIPQSQKYFYNKITEYVAPIHVSSKETYISYFINVNYVPEEDLPRAEDVHINYQTRYIRECRWFSLDEIDSMQENKFHKRLQITKIKQRIKNYMERGLFI